MGTAKKDASCATSEKVADGKQKEKERTKADSMVYVTTAEKQGTEVANAGGPQQKAIGKASRREKATRQAKEHTSKVEKDSVARAKVSMCLKAKHSHRSRSRLQYRTGSRIQQIMELIDS